MRCASSTTPRRRREVTGDPSYCDNTSNEKEAQEGVEKKKESKVVAAAGGKAEGQRKEGGCGGGGDGGGEQDRQRGMGKGVGRNSNGSSNVVVDEEFRPKRRFKVSGTIFEVSLYFMIVSYCRSTPDSFGFQVVAILHQTSSPQRYSILNDAAVIFLKAGRRL